MANTAKTARRSSANAALGTSECDAYISMTDAAASTGVVICAPLISAAPSSAEAGAGAPGAAGRELTMTEEEVEMIAEMESINASANKLITDHLDRYVRRMGTDATYEGWIGVLHPENVSLDSRLLLEGSAHQRMWKERVSTREGAPSDFWQALAQLTSHRVRGVTEGLSAGLAPRPPPEPTGRGRGCSSTGQPQPSSAGRGDAAAAAPESATAACGDGDGGPLDGSDQRLRTLEQSCDEVARLRKLLLTRPTHLEQEEAAAAAAGGRPAESARPPPPSLDSRPTGLDALLRAIGGGGGSGGAVPGAAAPATARTLAAPTSSGGGGGGGGSGSTAVGVDEAFGDLFARQERRSTVAEAAVPPGYRPPHSPVDELVAGLWGSADSPSQSTPGNPFGGSPAAPGNPFGATRPTPSQNLGTGCGAAANPFDM